MGCSFAHSANATNDKLIPLALNKASSQLPLKDNGMVSDVVSSMQINDDTTELQLL